MGGGNPGTDAGGHDGSEREVLERLPEATAGGLLRHQNGNIRVQGGIDGETVEEAAAMISGVDEGEGHHPPDQRVNTGGWLDKPEVGLRKRGTDQRETALEFVTQGREDVAVPVRMAAIKGREGATGAVWAARG